MNMNQIVSIAGRMLMRTLMRRGLSAGLNKVLGSGKKAQAATPEERATQKQSAENTKRAQKGIRNLRRFGRF